MSLKILTQTQSQNFRRTHYLIVLNHFDALMRFSNEHTGELIQNPLHISTKFPANSAMLFSQSHIPYLGHMR